MKNINTLHRDDDPNVYTDMYLFKQLHEKFIEAKQVHTVAVIMKDLWQNHALFYYLLTAPYLEIGLHGWEHKDYSLLSYKECFADLKKSLNYWFENGIRILGSDRIPEGKNIKIFFAPWNKTSGSIELACSDLGLKFCDIRKGRWEDYNIRSFHWWHASMDSKFKV